MGTVYLMLARQHYILQSEFLFQLIDIIDNETSDHT